MGVVLYFMYKVVFFDVDGTLLSETDGRMPPSTKEAIEQLLFKGIKVVVATGRPYSLCAELRNLGIETVISANGALITSHEEIIYRSAIQAETVRELSEFAALHGHGVAYFTDKLSMNGIGLEDERILRALKETLSLECYPQNAESLTGEVYCMCLYADENETLRFTEQFPALRFVRFHDYVLNVLEAAEVSKAVAVSRVLEHYNIPAAEAIAFGDGGNDMDMLECAGLGIAMGNGTERLKQRADFVTTKASEGGIAYALQVFGVI